MSEKKYARGKNPGSRNQPKIGVRKPICLSTKQWKFIEEYFGVYSEGMRQLVDMGIQSVIDNIHKAVEDSDIDPTPEALKAYISEHFPENKDDMYIELVTGKLLSLGDRFFFYKVTFIIQHNNKTLYESYQELLNGTIRENKCLPSEHLHNNGNNVSDAYIKWILKNKLGINECKILEKEYDVNEIENTATTSTTVTIHINIDDSEYKDVYVDADDGKSTYYTWE